MRGLSIFMHLSTVKRMCDLFCFWKAQWRTFLTSCPFLLLLGVSLVEGIRLSPCGSEGVQKVLADHETLFTCSAHEEVEWRLVYYEGQSSNDYKIKSASLARCDTTCSPRNTFNGLFTADVMNDHTTIMIIKALNYPKLLENVKFLNGSVECRSQNDENKSASCGLSYVYPPEGVSCSGINASWSVTVSCVISSVYSSRGLYTCQLHRIKNESINDTLEWSEIVTSPTKERIFASEFKMSGSCQFNTTLPSKEGNYSFYVAISPAGRIYSVNFTTGYNWITNELPHPPTVSCGSKPFLLENTAINCTCSTTSLGQPPGHLRWIIGNQTKEQPAARVRPQNVRSQDLLYTHHVISSDHGDTWFRCDVVRSQNVTYGINYTVRVGAVKRNLEPVNLAALVGVVCAVIFIFTIVALVVIRNRKKNKGPSVRSNRIPPPLRLHVEEAEVNVDISQPEPCQTPLYAVVDKTKKKANTRHDHIDEIEEQMEKSPERVSEPGLQLACEVVYAVVDKTRSKYPAKVDNPQKLGQSQAKKGQQKEVQMSEESRCNDNNVVQYQNVMFAPPAQDQDGGKWDVCTSAPRCHTVEDGKWLNSAGLLYTFPHFDLSSDLKCCPPPTQDETEYCTLRLI